MSRCDFRRHPCYHASPVKRRMDYPCCSHLLLLFTITRKQRKTVTIATTNTMPLQKNQVTQFGEAISGKRRKKKKKKEEVAATSVTRPTIHKQYGSYPRKKWLHPDQHKSATEKLGKFHDGNHHDRKRRLFVAVVPPPVTCFVSSIARRRSGTYFPSLEGSITHTSTTQKRRPTQMCGLETFQKKPHSTSTRETKYCHS